MDYNIKAAKKINATIPLISTLENFHLDSQNTWSLVYGTPRQGTITNLQRIDFWQRHQPSEAGIVFSRCVDSAALLLRWSCCLVVRSSRCGADGQQIMCNGNGRANVDIVQQEA